MSISHTSALTAVAFQLVAALERYQDAFDELVESWFDRARCHAVVHLLDEIRKLRCALPQLAVDMMEVAIRHTELLQRLWTRATIAPGAAVAGEIGALRGRHREAIEAMRHKCLRLLARGR
jgi:hypothetical protein